MWGWGWRVRFTACCDLHFSTAFIMKYYLTRGNEGTRTQSFRKMGITCCFVEACNFFTTAVAYICLSLPSERS